MAAGAAEFFEDMHGSPNHKYLGYRDFQLRTEHMSDVDWQDVDITTFVTPKCKLPNPIITAAMNCISEDDMAIAMGMSGGASFIHHVNTPEEQKKLAQNVYHYLGGIITSPFVAHENDTVEKVLMTLDERKKSFRTVPVRNSDGRCVGMMDESMFDLFDSTSTMSEAMYPLDEVDTIEAGMDAPDVFTHMKDNHIGRLLLLNENGEAHGLCLPKNIRRMLNRDPKEISLTDEGRLIAFASVPTITEEALERISLMKKYITVFGIDTSHGEHKYAVETLKAIREEHPDVEIMAGNISTEQTAREIAKLEPAAIQVGQGPGSICVSSDRLGFGTPQASAVYEVNKGAQSVNETMSVIADGSVQDSQDTVKAFACRARGVKVGGLVAGTDQTPVSAERNEETGALEMPYWGMGSERAQRAFAQARARYGHYGPQRKIIFVEGFEKKVPLKGDVRVVIAEHVMGIKLSMAAQGFRNVDEIQEGATFMVGAN